MLLPARAVAGHVLLLCLLPGLQGETACDATNIAVNTPCIIRVKPRGSVTEARVTIPAGHLVERGLKPNASEPRFLWNVTISLTLPVGFESESVTAVLQDGASTATVRLPYQRTTGRDKTVVTGSSARTVSLCPNETVNSNSTLLVSLVSSAPGNMTVELRAELVVQGEGWVPGLALADGREMMDRALSLSVSSPLTVFHPPVKSDERYVKLRVESPPESDCFCSVLSVQQPACPYFDSVSTATRFGFSWQTVKGNSSMVLKKKNFPNGFVIVMVATESDEFCTKKKKTDMCPNQTNKTRSNMKKHVSISLEPIGGDKTRLTAVLVTMACYLAIICICCFLSYIQFRFDYGKFEGIILKRSTILPIIAFAAQHGPMAVVPTEKKTDDVVEPPTEELEKGGVGVLHTETLDHLCQKLDQPGGAKSLYKKNSLYMGSFLLISVFYAIAVYQLAFQAAAEHRNGEFDKCYFNSRCQIPAGPFLDFNHFFSNLGYVVFGLIFIGIVYLRRRRFNMDDANIGLMHGVPFLYGVYYTMGGAIAMEGLMSASYHICPTTISFQFDTTFMYLIAILICVKLYQNRHPDTTANSIKVYLVLGVALILEALSLYFDNGYFWAVFCIIYMLGLVSMVTNLYQLNTKRHNKRFLPFRVVQLLSSESINAVRKVIGKEKIKVRPLLVLLTLISTVNIAMCIYFGYNASNKDVTASNYLLMMFIANMVIYLIYYVVMKYLSKEHLCLQAKVYFAAASVCCLPAMYFFLNKEKNSNISPAESRDLNQPCQLLDFYDGHDIWHFLGGAGVFFNYMFLLTIDEDIKYRQRSHISVF